MAVSFDTNQCCGCMACKNICPKGAITMMKDKFGFMYPKVDKSKCIECHLCEKVCDFNKTKRNDNITKKAYSLINRDKSILYQSTSGGAFTVLSDIILEKKGIVFGAVMDENFDVYHIEAKDKKTRDEMRGSKYIQSNMGEVYTKVEELLKNNKDVLFVGSPCQVGGLISFLRKPYKKLITVEFLCHGVPNNQFFKEHIKYLEIKYNQKAKKYSFRNKKFLWRGPGIEEITFDSGKTKDSKKVNAYIRFFYDNVSLRPSCYNCTYRKYERCADITIADFWGIEKITGKQDLHGVSLVLANSDKGLLFIEDISEEKAKVTEVPYDKVKKNMNIKKLIPKYNIDEFWKDYIENDYEYLIKKYLKNSLISNTEFILKKECRKAIAKLIN